MDNKEFQNLQLGSDSNEQKTKKIWIHIGVGLLALLLGVFTVIVVAL